MAGGGVGPRKDIAFEALGCRRMSVYFWLPRPGKTNSDLHTAVAMSKRPKVPFAVQIEVFVGYPTGLNRARYVLLVLAALQVVVGFLFVLNRRAIGEKLSRVSPCSEAVSARGLQGCIHGTIVGTVGMHAALLVLLQTLSKVILRPARWRRVTATIVLMFFIFSSYFVLSAKGVGQIFPSSMYPSVVAKQMIALVLEGYALWCLWMPPAVKHFFSSHGPSKACRP